MATTTKKLVNGFSNLYYNVLSANTDAAYTLGSYVRINDAQSVTQTETRNELLVRGDDAIAFRDSEFQEGELQITVAGLPLTSLAALKGVTMVGEVMEETNIDNAPDVALTFSAKLAGGAGHRLFQYFACKLSAVKASDLTTKGMNNDISNVTLTFKYYGRACDGRIRATQDVDATADIAAALNAIIAFPAPGTPG